MQQLSAPARQFAISAADSRRLAPVRLRTARFVRAIAPALTAAQVPWPILIVLTAIGSIIAKSADATAVSAIEAARPRKLVVWLRRFHQIGYDRFPLKDLFEELSSWGLLAYTLSDDAVYRSTLAERVIRRWVRQRVMQLPDGARLLKIRNIIGGVLFFVSLLGMAPVLIATRDYSGWIQLFSVLCFIGSMVLTYEIAIRLQLRHFYRSRKFREVYKPLFVEAIIESFSISAVKAPTYFRDAKEKVANRKMNLTTGFFAMSVVDADWQQVVHEAVDHADAILVDVTEISENLEWELGEIAKNCKLERVVLAFGFSREFDSSEEWQSHPSSASLDRLLGTEWRNRCQKFSYPQRVDRKMERQIEERMHQLAMRIYEAVVS
jgi:hypothetical protein